MRRLSRGAMACAMLAGLFIAACGSESPVRPSQTSTPVPIPAPRVVPEIRVWVYDTAFRRLPGAQVQIVSGPATGTVRMTGSLGEAIFSGSFLGIVTFEAIKDGYVTVTRSLNVAGLCDLCTSAIGLAMESVDPIVRLDNGSYLLTFTADQKCTGIPPELRTRTYAVTVTHASGDFAGSYFVDVPDMLFGQSRFLIGISGRYLATEDGGYPTLFERVATDRYLGIDFLAGTTDVHIAGGSIDVALPGSFEFCAVTSGIAPAFCDAFSAAHLIAHERCDGTDFRMTLARR